LPLSSKFSKKFSNLVIEIALKMKINLVAYGISKDILKTKQLSLEINTGDSIGLLKQQLLTLYPDFAKLKSIAFAVKEEYQTDDYTLNENDEVVIIPPVSGG
jgi:molybdopterin converting factor small subunit